MQTSSIDGCPDQVDEPTSISKTPQELNDAIASRVEEEQNDNNYIPTGSELRLGITNMIKGTVNLQECKVLMYMLRNEQEDILKDGLKLIISLSTKSAGITRLLFQANCAKELKRLLNSYKQDGSISKLVITAINNLSLSPEGQVLYENTVEQLLDICSTDPNLREISLQALTNISVTDGSHSRFTRLVQQLYILLDDGNEKEKLQMCKLLVNLSTNQNLIQYLLAAKAPSSTVSLLQDGFDMIALRWLRFLVNLSNGVREYRLTAADLPNFYKAPSPETMYNVLFSSAGNTNLINCLLSRKSSNQEVISLTNQLYNHVK